MQTRLGFIAAAVALVWPWAAVLADAGFANSLDKPAAVRRVKPKSDADPVGEITCTYHADVMVRESGVDTPEPADATLIALTRGGRKPPCAAGRIAGGIKLKTEGYALVGRKGPFLVWDVSDPNGAMPFMVMLARGGKTLFEDGLTPALGARRSATLQNGVLRLAYRRGFNAPCSLMQNARACWLKIAAADKAPTAMAPLAKAPPSCRAAYRGVAADDPSIVLYDVDLTLDTSGQVKALARGPASCMPQP